MSFIMKGFYVFKGNISINEMFWYSIEYLGIECRLQVEVYLDSFFFYGVYVNSGFVFEYIDERFVILVVLVLV